MTWTRGESKRIVVSLVSIGCEEKSSGHLGIEIDESDAFDLRILQDFANRQAVAAAKNQDAARSREQPRGRDESALRDSGIRRAS